MAKINLSHFKKVSSNKDFTVMRHKDGHEIKIAHRALSPQMKMELEGLQQEPQKMTDGGPVLTPKEFDDSFNKVPKPIPPKAGPTYSSVSPAQAIEQGKKKTFEDRTYTQQPTSDLTKPEDQKTVGELQASQPEDPTAQLPDNSPMPNQAVQPTPPAEPLFQAKGGAIRQNYDDGGEAQSLAKLAPLLLAMAKGGQVKDPTQEHLLSGDAIPNKIEKQVVSQAKQRMADGGEVSQEQQAPDPQTNGAPQTPTEAPSQDQPQQQAQVPAETQVRRNLYNEQVKNMALSFPESATESDKNRMIKAQQFGPNGEPPEHFNTQAATASSQRAEDADKAAISANKASIVQANANNDALAKMGLPPQPVPQDMSPQSSDLNNIQQNVALANQNQQPAQPAIKDPYGMDQAYNQWQTGMKQRLQGINAEAMATGKMGTNQAEALQQGISTQQTLDHNYTDQINRMNQERQHMLDDMDNNHIDPNRYVNNMSTGDRIKSSIGLILGGFGAVAGQGNMAYQTLQNNITRDIDAQKSNMSQRNSMLSNNLAQFGNVRDAATWHQVMSNDIIAKQVQMQAAKLQGGPNGLAQARAKQLEGQLNQDSSQKVAEMGMRRALMNSAQGSPSSPQFLQMLRVMNPEMAKEMEGRLVPNGGPNGEPAYAQVPVPQPVRDNILGKQTLDARAKDLYQWASQHSGELSPSERNIGQTKAAELQSMYRSAINGGVFKKGEQEYIDKIISSDPSEFFNKIRVLPQLKTIIGSNAAQLNAVKQSVGLPVAQGTQAGGSYKNPTFKKVR